MNINVRKLRAFLILSSCHPVILSGLAGCSPVQPPPRSTGKPIAQKPQENSLPSEVKSQGITARWREKSQAGAARRVMEIEAESGIMKAEMQSGVMQKARGLLFREDRPRARFVAPVVEAKEEMKTVLARGGVHMFSIEPPGITLTADRMTWYANQHKIVAEGSVRIEQRPAGSAQPIAWCGPTPRMTLNTELQRFTIP